MGLVGRAQTRSTVKRSTRYIQHACALRNAAMSCSGPMSSADRDASTPTPRLGGPTSLLMVVTAALSVLLVGAVGTWMTRFYFMASPMSTAVTGLAGLEDPHPFRDWMGKHWRDISDRPLWQLTLPGTHNSGNTLELSTEPLYPPDANYGKYVEWARGRGLEPLGEEQFHRRFLPWNTNHHADLMEQLRNGIRWFHLKVCNMDAASEAPALGRVLHCHRGYTATSLEAIVEAISQFLGEHVHEFAVLGLNNLYGFSDTQRHALARQLERAFAAAGLQLATAAELRRASLANLAREQKRVAVFMADPGPGNVIDSTAFLSENWGPAGDSGDLAAYTDWMVQDIRTHALKSDRFYVVQANPNNNDTAAFLSLHSRPPPSLYMFEYGFLRSLAPTVLSTIRSMASGAHINAISTDFMHEARVTELALSLTFTRHGLVT